MNEFLFDMLRTTLSLLAPVIAGLIAALLVQQLRKMGLVLSAEKTAKVEYLVTQAIFRVEEWAAARDKAGQTTTPAMKKEKALKDVEAILPKASRDDASALIQARLPQIGLGASGPFQVPPEKVL